MSGFGRGRGAAHGRAIAPLRRGMPPKKNQQTLGKGAAAAAAGGGRDPVSNGIDESFQLVSSGNPQFAMMIRLTPGLLDELKRVEAAGGTVSMKFGANSSGHVIKVGQEEFKFTSAPEAGDLCNIFEEQRHGEDGQGLLSAVGAAWRKISVQRTLSASEKDRVKQRSVEAEQQMKSRKAIVLDSLMKADGTSAEAGRRPPLKTKKEPLLKKRKIAPAATSAKPKQLPVQSTPSKDKPAPPPPPPPPPPAPSAPMDDLPPPQPPPAATSSRSVSPPSQQPPSSTTTVRPVVEEIVVGVSPQNKVAQKQKASSTASTPEVQARLSVALSSTDLRNSLIILLTENPRGMTLKAVEKSLSELAPHLQAGRKNIEKVIKSIASYHAPGRYMLKPGIKPETFTKPSPGSGSLPDVAVDSPESPAGAAESLPQRKMPTAESEWNKRPGSNVEMEHIDVGESPAKSPAKPEGKEEVDVAMEDAARDEEEIQAGHIDGNGSHQNDHSHDVPAEAAAKPKGTSSGSSGTSGSESDSDSDSDTSSGSASSGSSGSDSGSSSEDDDEDEDVDIMSDGENHSKQKSRKSNKHDKAKVSKVAQKPPDEELHKDTSRSSEDIDIGDADDSTKADAAVERIIETIDMDVDESSFVPSPSKSDKKDEDVQAHVPVEADPVQELDESRYPEQSYHHMAKESPQVPKAGKPDLERTSRAREQRPSSDKVRDDSERRMHEQPKADSGNRYRAPASTGQRPSAESKRNEYQSSDIDLTPQDPPSERKKSSSKRPGKADRTQKDAKRNKAGRRSNELPIRNVQSDLEKTDIRGVQRTENDGNSDLELGEFREPTPEQNVSKSDDALKPDRSKTARKLPSPALDARRPEPKKPAEDLSVASRYNTPSEAAPPPAKEKPAVAVAKAAAPRKAEQKNKDNLWADSVRSTDFFAPYEKDAAELRGPIKSQDQYSEYNQEFQEKYQIYLELHKALDTQRKTFESLAKEMDMSKGDQNRLARIGQKITTEYKSCRSKFKRMTKTFDLLHDELRAIKDRCREYARQL